MNHSASSESVLDVTIIQGTTWFERLLMNILSYSLVLIPIAFTVITIRYRICPNFLHSNTLLQKFVNGYDPSAVHSKPINLGSRDDAKLLLSQSGSNERSRSTRQYQPEQWKYSKVVSFIWCLLGLQVSYLIWGLLQEKIMTTKYLVTSGKISSHSDQVNPNNVHNNSTSHNTYITFHESQFLVFFNRIVAFITALIGLLVIHIKNQQTRRRQYYSSSKYIASSIIDHEASSKPSTPLYEFVYCSLSNILSSWCQYEALKYVNFPTQCLSKSCKIIPVMLMSRLLLRKRYRIVDYLCAILLALGTFIFILNQQVPKLPSHPANVHPTKFNKTVIPAINSSSLDSAPVHDGLVSSLHRSNPSTTLMSGLILLMLYLTFDSFTSNWQQSLYNKYSISNWQMMAAINFYSILLTLTSLHQLGDLKPSILLLTSSSALFYDCLLMSIMSSLGQMFVYYTIKRFGPVVFAIIMTLRQFLSILLSCLTYGHKLNFGSTIGLIIVFLVAFYQVWYKRCARTGNKVTVENYKQESNDRRLQQSNSKISENNINGTVQIEFERR